MSTHQRSYIIASLGTASRRSIEVVGVAPSSRNSVPVRQRYGIGGITLVFAVLFLPSAGTAGTVFLDPSPYLSQADSPFDLSGLGTTFFLEDFEDGLLNTPGVQADSLAQVWGPSSYPFIHTDSVDADDGLIDGSGSTGRSIHGSGLLISGNIGVSVISFYFDVTPFGQLPTHVGLVCTDGVDQIRFDAFGPNGELLGRLVMNGFGDGEFGGGTSEDRFFGVIDPNGISEIRLFVAVNGDFVDPEVDHLQYGIVPEPSSWVILFSAGLILTAQRVRRTLHKRRLRRT